MENYVKAKSQNPNTHITRDEVEQFPLVSVIIPTYNRPELMIKAVESVLNQSIQNFEIVVVNDAGVDVSGEVEKFGDDRIHYVSRPVNSGLSAARNSGINKSRGKYIAYLDDDDIYFPDHLETLSRFLENNPNYQVAYSNAVYSHRVWEEGKQVETHREIKYSLDFDRNRLMVGNYIPVLCIMHRKDCLQNSGIFDTSLGRLEDWDLWIRMSRTCQFMHIPEVTCEVSWLEDGTTMTSQGLLAFYYAYLKVYCKNYDFLGNDVLAKVKSDIYNYLEPLRESVISRALFQTPEWEVIFGRDDVNQVIQKFTHFKSKFGQEYEGTILESLAYLHAINQDHGALFSTIQEKRALDGFALESARSKQLALENLVNERERELQEAARTRELELLNCAQEREAALQEAARTCELELLNSAHEREAALIEKVKRQEIELIGSAKAREMELLTIARMREGELVGLSLEKEREWLEKFILKENEYRGSIEALKNELKNSYDSRIQEMAQALHQRDQEILAYATSKSWRITRPLRKITRFMKGEEQG